MVLSVHVFLSTDGIPVQSSFRTRIDPLSIPGERNTEGEPVFRGKLTEGKGAVRPLVVKGL